MKRKVRGHIILRVLREAAGLSQFELAEAMNTERKMVSRVEAGQAIDADMLQRWVDACGGLDMIDWLVRHLRALRRQIQLILNTDYHAYA